PSRRHRLRYESRLHLPRRQRWPSEVESSRSVDARHCGDHVAIQRGRVRRAAPHSVELLLAASASPRLAALANLCRSSVSSGGQAPRLSRCREKRTGEAPVLHWNSTQADFYTLRYT